MWNDGNESTTILDFELDELFPLCFGLGNLCLDLLVRLGLDSVLNWAGALARHSKLLERRGRRDRGAKMVCYNSSIKLDAKMLRVAYLGHPGAYSENAANKAYPNCEPIICDQLEVEFQTVELRFADRSVLPVENSLAGSIHRNYDLLLRHRLHIVGEVHLPIHHCLLALPGARKENLTRIISHPQALAQRELTLTKLGLNVSLKALDSTTMAAEFVASNNLKDTAVIASTRTAELYGLHILEDGIQDDPRNVTRFVMLAREPYPIIPRTDTPYKTSIGFAQYKGKSVMHKVFSAFAYGDIGVTKMEIRPHRKCPIRVVDDANLGTTKYFEYVFYVDFEASMAEIRAQKAIAEVEKLTSFLRVFGSYPMDMTPWCPGITRRIA
ncbi:hypothetical protein HHK36_019287 [Tetracentron sinense]|uniref:Prephenate dehydratase domain-containing protein n=1 Tax=Tetracentron sinense TaxID=13715 RepID=A0A835D9X1_TETSI|nr:hypothetical protein HHK36_019287 [Tetracentron sinense]